MTRPWRIRAGRIALLVGVSAALVAAPAADPAVAAPTATPDATLYVQTLTAPGKLDLTVTARAGTTAVAIDPGSVHVSVTPQGGSARQLTTRVAGSAADAHPKRRAAMLLVDVSGSMSTNNYFAAAKAAAKQFLTLAPSDVSVGLVTFGDPAKVVQAPTTDRHLLNTKIDDLTTAGDTAMYQAVTKGAAAMGGFPLRSIVLLTDGQNTDRQTSSTDAQAALQGHGGQADVAFEGVLIGTDPAKAINAIATSKNVFRDNSGDLAGRLSTFFQNQAQTYTLQQDVEAIVPAALAGRQGNVTVTATVNGKAITPFTSAQVLPGQATSGTVPAGSAPTVVPARGLTAITTPVAVAALLCLFAGLMVLIFLSTGALVGRDEKESQVVRRLQVYSVTGTRPKPVVISEQTTRLGANPLTRSAVGLVDRLTALVQLERSLDSRLEAAGLPLRTAEWTLLHLGSAVGLSLLFLVVTRGDVAGLVIGLAVGLVVPWLVLGFLKSQRERKFMGQLPDTLQLLAGSIASGYSLPQAMDSVVREAEPPISSEFNRALVEARLGLLAEDALDGIATRTGSRDFSWIVLAIRIQREVGGNLSALLNSVADTLRERERLRRQVSALSAEGRLSGLILGALPVVFAIYLVLARPTYIDPLFSTPLGLTMLVIGSVLLVIGGFWMSRLVKVKV